jgi:hypothetical protein
MERLTQIALIIFLATTWMGLESCAGLSSAPPAPASVATPAQVPPPGNLTEAQTSPAAALPQLPSDPAGQSRVITEYLKSNRLPLVGAQALDSGTGREVILYGFVATPEGKSDAEEKTRQVVDDPSVEVVDRIKVRPELLTAEQDLAAEATSSATSRDANNAMSQIASTQSYPAADQTQQYVSQQQTSWESWVIPLLMIATMFIP